MEKVLSPVGARKEVGGAAEGRREEEAAEAERVQGGLESREVDSAFIYIDNANQRRSRASEQANLIRTYTPVHAWKLLL